MSKKKDKITYVDDGRTVADMSGVSSGFRLSKGKYRPAPKAKDVWKTYWNAVRMMFVPMLVVVCAIIIIYMLLSVAFLLM